MIDGSLMFDGGLLVRAFLKETSRLFHGTEEGEVFVETSIVHCEKEKKRNRVFALKSQIVAYKEVNELHSSPCPWRLCAIPIRHCHCVVVLYSSPRSGENPADL
jgi:hypothetical protein